VNKKTKQVQVRFDPGLYVELHGELVKQNVFVDDFFNYLARKALKDKKHFQLICSNVKFDREKKENE